MNRANRANVRNMFAPFNLYICIYGCYEFLLSAGLKYHPNGIFPCKIEQNEI